MEVSAGDREKRGLNRLGTVRSAANASRRWRRTNRSASTASSNGPSCGTSSEASSAGGVAEAGNPTASSSALDTRSPRRPSASTARAVSPSDGRAWTTATSRARTPMIGIAAPMTGAASSGMNRATVQRTASATTTAARAIQARRTMRRSHRRRRCGASDARSASIDGSSSPARCWRGSGGMTAPPTDGDEARRTNGRRNRRVIRWGSE